MSVTPLPNSGHPAGRIDRRLFVALAALAVIGLLIWNRPRPQSVGNQNHPVASNGQVEPTETRDQQLARQVVGVWFEDDRGKKTMTLCEDGTGTMIVELTGITAATYADRLQFNMLWRVEDERLLKTSVGGEPEKKVQLILKLMGNQVSEPILEVDADHLLLLDENGTKEHDWKSVAPDDSEKPTHQPS